MMMIESNPGPYSEDGKAGNLQVMDVMIEWADKNISKPPVQACGNEGGGNGNGKAKGHDKGNAENGKAKGHNKS